MGILEYQVKDQYQSKASIWYNTMLLF